MTETEESQSEEKNEDKHNELLQEFDEEYIEESYDNRYHAKVAKDYVSSNTWIVSFTDIMALMLTFFVLLYSMSNPEENKWEEMTSGLQKQLNKSISSPHNRGVQDAVEVAKINFKVALDLNYLSSIVNGLIEENENLKGIKTKNVANGLAIAVPESMLFEENKAAISDTGSKMLYFLAGKLHRIKNRIEIAGYRVNNNASEYEQNNFNDWSLSMNRALAISAVLYKTGYQNPVTIKSFHERDFLSNSPQENTDISENYVDIVIMSDDGTVIR